MGMSLRDQLLKKGLVDKKQVKKAKHEQHVNRKKNKGKKAPQTHEANEARQAQLAQQELNKEQNLQRNAQKLKKENQTQVKQLIKSNKLDLKKNCNDPYYFKIEKKIKKIYVNEDLSKKLSNGFLAIVSLNDLFEIVPAKIAEQILARDPDAMVILHKPGDD